MALASRIGNKGLNFVCGLAALRRSVATTRFGFLTTRSLSTESMRYTEDHEWIRYKDGIGTVGITDHAQKELGDIVYCELYEAGSQLSIKDEFGLVESVKSSNSLYTPLGGELVEANKAVVSDKGGDPSIINKSPYKEGWLIKIKVADPAELDELMSENEYDKYVGDDKED